ncbi:SDR family oxidoreductase [Streptomyces sp. NPDC056160]|uniref:SDR family oxidoreductase n=1 Tax=Streptomyces sp. NPDC056160 TaxID=3345731 RepID=UPI0035D903A8
MELEIRIIVVTGGGSGIGRPLVERFAQESPRGIVVVDRDADAAEAAVRQVGGLAVTADLTREAEVERVIAEADAHFGPVDVFCSNAGIVPPVGGFDAPDEGWQQHWNIQVMAHMCAARALVPAMAARGESNLLNVASAAGLLMSPGAVPYTVTKRRTS